MKLQEAFNHYPVFKDEILDDACYGNEMIAKCIIRSYIFINKFGHTERADKIFLECMRDYLKGKEL